MEVRFSFLQTTPVVVRNVEGPLMIVTMIVYILLNRMTMKMTMSMMIMRIRAIGMNDDGRLSIVGS